MCVGVWSVYSCTCAEAGEDAECPALIILHLILLRQNLSRTSQPAEARSFGDLPASATRCAGITGTCGHTKTWTPRLKLRSLPLHNKYSYPLNKSLSPQVFIFYVGNTFTFLWIHSNKDIQSLLYGSIYLEKIYMCYRCLATLSRNCVVSRWHECHQKNEAVS